MIQQVLSFIQSHHMIESGEHILVGVSGGADSVCLLRILDDVRTYWNCKLSVIHIEHGIRGEESQKDAEFVKTLCETYQIPCYVYSCDAIKFAKEQNMSLEEAARELRYQYFEQARKELEADKIAVAHNQNDSAETLIFHMIRGTGLGGMCGIAPVRGKIIRPLLCVNRKEIEGFLKEKQQGFRTDATNFQTEYSRNKIRHQVLPVFQEMNPQAVSHLYQCTGYLSQAWEFIETIAREQEQKILRDTLIHISLLQQPPLLQNLIIFHQLERIAGSKKDLSGIHIRRILDLFQKQVGKKIILPYDICAIRQYDGVTVEKIKETAEAFSTHPIIFGESFSLSPYPYQVTCKILEKKEKFEEIPQKTYTKWFDYDRIKGTLLFRTRLPGDYFILDDFGSRQKVKKYFVNEKIPQKERQNVLLLADGAHVLWMVGHRISWEYKVTAQTKRILEVCVRNMNGGETDE